MVLASRKSRMRAPPHWRTEVIGACLADPFANGEGGKKWYVHHPKRRRRRVYQPGNKIGHDRAWCQPKGGASARTRSPHTPYRQTDCELRVQRSTRVICLPVSFDSEVRLGMPQMLANFGIGTLAADSILTRRRGTACRACRRCACAANGGSPGRDVSVI